MKPSRIILECLLFTILEDNNHEQRNKNAADPKEIITGHTIQYSSVRLSFHFLDSFQWTSDPTGKTEIFRRKTKNARFSILTQFHDSKKKNKKEEEEEDEEEEEKEEKKKKQKIISLAFICLFCCCYVWFYYRHWIIYLNFLSLSLLFFL